MGMCTCPLEHRSWVGQKVAPPPFNDRCVAVSGRCGSACNDDEGLSMGRLGEGGYQDRSKSTVCTIQECQDLTHSTTTTTEGS